MEIPTDFHEITIHQMTMPFPLKKNKCNGDYKNHCILDIFSLQCTEIKLRSTKQSKYQLCSLESSALFHKCPFKGFL